MKYDTSLSEIRRLITTVSDRSTVMAKVVEYLADHFPHYSWVGIYWVDGKDLVLGPWKGPEATEHTRIPIGSGVCGAAAASGKTEVIPDVSRDPRYLTCFPSTKSEIVVPIINNGIVLGEIDIDSDQLAPFTPEDARFLEEVARLLSKKETRAPS